ncbi:unnamed protein product, partial [Meganyctiphanes norvegica]
MRYLYRKITAIMDHFKQEMYFTMDVKIEEHTIKPEPWSDQDNEVIGENSKNNIHIKDQRIQADGKQFQCSQCNKSFTRKDALIRHQRIHAGEKSFQCSQCSKSFAHKGNLISHQRIHAGEKPFQCDQCSKSFAHKGDLIRHQRIHAGE